MRRKTLTSTDIFQDIERSVCENGLPSVSFMYNESGLDILMLILPKVRKGQYEYAVPVADIERLRIPAVNWNAVFDDLCAMFGRSIEYSVGRTGNAFVYLVDKVEFRLGMFEVKLGTVGLSVMLDARSRVEGRFRLEEYARLGSEVAKRLYLYLCARVGAGEAELGLDTLRDLFFNRSLENAGAFFGVKVADDNDMVVIVVCGAERISEETSLSVRAEPQVRDGSIASVRIVAAEK